MNCIDMWCRKRVLTQKELFQVLMDETTVDDDTAVGQGSFHHDGTKKERFSA